MECKETTNIGNEDHPKELPYIAMNYGIGIIEAAILEELAKETDIAKIAEEIKIKYNIDIDEKEIRSKIELMREKGVIKRIAPIVDPMMVWNHLYFVLIKSRLTPPVLAVDVDYPTGWKDLCDTVLEIINGDKIAQKIVRQMYALQGTEWDLLLKVTTNDMGELRILCEKITSCGFIEKVWSFEPVKGSHHYFEPIGIPPASEMIEGIRRAKELSDKF